MQKAYCAGNLREAASVFLTLSLVSAHGFVQTSALHCIGNGLDGTNGLQSYI